MFSNNVLPEDHLGSLRPGAPSCDCQVLARAEVYQLSYGTGATVPPLLYKEKRDHFRHQDVELRNDLALQGVLHFWRITKNHEDTKAHELNIVKLFNFWLSKKDQNGNPMPILPHTDGWIQLRALFWRFPQLQEAIERYWTDNGPFAMTGIDWYWLVLIIIVHDCPWSMNVNDSNSLKKTHYNIKHIENWPCCS